MTTLRRIIPLLSFRLLLTVACFVTTAGQGQEKNRVAAERLAQYAPVTLTADLGKLSDRQRQMLVLLIDAAKQMDKIFWQQSSGERAKVLAGIDDIAARQFTLVNYGPWDRLNNNRSFVKGIGRKPAGAQFYPQDMTKDEFQNYVKRHPKEAESLKSLYTLVRRSGDNLKAIPYHSAFAKPTRIAANKLKQAAELADNMALRRYLLARSKALLTDEYQASDMLWMDMKDNTIDIVIGPIETYEDQLFGYKAAHEAYVLIKDQSWSDRLSKYARLLPELQNNLPVPAAYRKETPGRKSDLNAYDVVYYAGDCNAGAKTIAINLPNDEQVQLAKGSRRLQLKNTMKAKFDRIVVPIGNTLIVPDQRKHITFDAFFSNTMFHEVAHGLGIKNTLSGKGTVRSALREQSSALEEGKADILGLYMATYLHEKGLIGKAPLDDYYVTFLASVFRSIRFGASSAHGRANLLRFNYFKKQGVFSRNEKGLYRVHTAKLRTAMKSLSAKILKLQGNGDYQGAIKLMKEMGQPGFTLRSDLERLNRGGIPVDIVFRQGVDVLKLK